MSILKVFAIPLVFWSGCCFAADRPNIVFVLADDLGYGDVGYNGGPAPTPRIDRLVRDGVELTQHYVAHLCSPTRAALLSGRFWSRFGVTSPQAERAFPWDTVTLPQALQSVGYDTAITGKWHLGSLPEWGPRKFGFDHTYGSLGGGVGPWVHRYKVGPYMQTWHRDDDLLEEQGHVTDLVAREAVQWIESRGERPFFLYVPFQAVHLPLKEPPEWLDRVPAGITGEVPRHYAACVMHLDDAVGRIVDAVERAGKRESTLIVFTSDNGGSWAENGDTKYPDDVYPSGKLVGRNVPFRGQKGQLYEGGIHVAAVANWPGRLQPGKCGAPIHVSDWMPTLCGLAGYTPPHDLRWDGRNVWPQLTGAEPPAPRMLYWAGSGFKSSAVRVGDWKLITQSAATPPKVELYDLAADPGESTDLAAAQPERVAELQRVLREIAASDRDAKVANGN